MRGRRGRGSEPGYRGRSAGAWPGAGGRGAGVWPGAGVGVPGCGRAPGSGCRVPGVTVGPISLGGKRSGTANLSITWLIMKVSLALNQVKLDFHPVRAR